VQPHSRQEGRRKDALLARRKVAVRVLRRHAHRRVDWRWRRRAVRGASRARVVLGAAPAETDTRVADGVTLHLVDGHLSGVTLDELNKATALSGRDLDIGDFAEALEERTELILGDVARESTNENSGIVGVGELVHGLGSTVVAGHGRSTHGVHAHGVRAPRHATHARCASGTALVLGSGGADAHRPVAAVDTLHLTKSALLVTLVGKANEAVASGEAADRVGHDLGGLARVVLGLEQRHENILVDLGAEVADEDGELGTTVVTTAVGKATARGPVELELAVAVRDNLAVKLESLGCRIRAFEINKAVASVASGGFLSVSAKCRCAHVRCLPRKFVADHLDVDLVAHTEPDGAHEVLINPRLKLAHPVCSSASSRTPGFPH
jgi:hypothetical protein